MLKVFLNSLLQHKQTLAFAHRKSWYT